MITDFISRRAVQTIVYWGGPTPDGYGGYTFDEAVEISGRWEQATEVITSADGEEILSQARVFITQDVDEDGYMYLGEIDDLDSNHEDPREIDGALRIVASTKIPALGSTDRFMRKAHLNMSKSTTV